MKKIKAGSFIPLPVAPVVLVGANVDGKANYMTVGFVNGVNINPPIVSISLNKNHHTPEGIKENGTFSINIPSADFIKKTDYCGLVSGKTINKSAVFTSFYGELETAPMIEEFPISCECKYINKSIEFEMDTVYFAEIHQVYLNEEITDNSKNIDLLKVNPLLIGIDSKYRSIGENVGQAYKIGWEYSSEKGSTMVEKSSDKYQCNVIDKAVQYTLSVIYKGTIENTQQVIGGALYKIMQYARKHGARPVGAPYVAYNGRNGHDIDIEIGLPFGERLIENSNSKSKDNIQTGEIPAGKYVSCIHVGTYRKLAVAHAFLQQWMRENGHVATEKSYEFYLNDPQETEPEQLKTQVLYKIK